MRCERADGREELGKFSFDQPPDERVVHFRVAVDEHVAKRDEPAMFGDFLGEGGIALRALANGLADDLELALNPRPMQPARLVVGERLAGGELTD